MRMTESIGKRLAYLRQKNGWTQQSLADRLAMSRVAISHIEMDLTVPSERSITLMAGVFKMSPMELVDGTTYPKAKAERLPELTTTYSALELNHALLVNDTKWLDRLDNPQKKKNGIHEVLELWHPLIENWENNINDEHEKKTLHEMQKILKDLSDRINHSRI
jgi:transcriptional regulator with XRE-family HTH domain